MAHLRLAIGGIQHESNTFNPRPTPLADFRIERGQDVVLRWGQARHEISGFVKAASELDYEVVPTMMAFAWPAGPVTREAFDALTGELITLLKNASPLDGLLLALHGAMVSEADPDGDGAVLKRLRQVLGKDFPIVVTHDYHANVSQAEIENCLALLIEQTNPHVDQLERGMLAARILTDTIRGKRRPVQALSKPPIIHNIVFQNTSAEPAAGFRRAAQELEKQAGILAVSVAGGYQFADVVEMGPSVVVVADGDMALAQREAERLSDMVFQGLSSLSLDLPDAARAVQLAKASPATPVVLVDMGDNVGGGSSADSTFVLKELLAQGAEGWVVVLADPEAAQACARAGIGATLALDVGGKMDRFHGEPVRVTGRVKCLHDGQFEELHSIHGGQRYFDQGLTAVLQMPGPALGVQSYIVLITERVPPVSLQQLISVGIQPQGQKILVAKAVMAHRAAYAPIAGRTIEVDTPGLTTVNPARYTYRHVRRPMRGMGRQGDDS